MVNLFQSGLHILEIMYNTLKLQRHVYANLCASSAAIVKNVEPDAFHRVGVEHTSEKEFFHVRRFIFHLGIWRHFQIK